MKQGTITSIAAAIAQDFARTVEAAEKEQAAAIAEIAEAQGRAVELREQRQTEIDAKRREAAELVAESMRLEEDANAEFKMAMATTRKDLSQLSGDKLIDAGKLKLISNKKAA